MEKNETITADNVKSIDTDRIITSDSVNNSDSQDTTITDNVVNINSNKTLKKNPVYANLDMLTTEEARKRGRAGGKKSGEMRKAKKTMRETLQDALTLELPTEKLAEMGADISLLNGNNTILSAIVASTIREAINGDTKAIQFVRDSIGEQPKQEISQEIITKDDTELLNKLKATLIS